MRLTCLHTPSCSLSGRLIDDKYAENDENDPETAAGVNVGDAQKSDRRHQLGVFAFAVGVFAIVGVIVGVTINQGQREPQSVPQQQQTHIAQTVPVHPALMAMKLVQPVPVPGVSIPRT